MAQQHNIMIGRTSTATAQDILGAFNPAHGDGLTVSNIGNVFQSYFGKVGHESIFELFVTGKQPHHPIEQNLKEEQRAQIQKQLEGSHVTIVHALSGQNTDGRAMSLLDSIFYMKEDLGVNSISLIAPHMSFMRNDRHFRRMLDGQVIDQRNAISSKYFARMLAFAGVDEVISFEAHSQDGINHFQKEFKHGSVNFHPMDEFAAKAFLKHHGPITMNGDWTLAVGAPDGLNKHNDLGIARAKNVGLSLYANSNFGGYTPAHKVADIPWMFGIHKDRINDTETKILNFEGNVQGREVFLIDDIIASGGTTINAADLVKKKGAKSCIAFATHGVLDGDAITKLAKAESVDKVILSDSTPGVVERLQAAGELGESSKFRVASLGQMIVEDIKEVHNHRKLRWAQPITAI